MASGDPSPDGFVLWTRLAPFPINGGGMPKENVDVRWELADDDQMKQIVRSGNTTASPHLAHSVHVELDGLDPNRWYWYRFQAGDAVSPVGRTRTAPWRNTIPDSIRFVFASCQHYESGYFNAYRHMAQDDLDIVIHLGDYIYEGGVGTNGIRQHNGPELSSLDDYRNRHALYRSDPDLQAAHAMCPWLVTWDDHEFDNNYASAVSEQVDIDTQAFLTRRAGAYQAYYEHMPLRKSSIPRGPLMQLYRTVPFGRLVEFNVLDTRQYRSDQPCGDRNGPLCKGALAENATLLGDRQEHWLMRTLRRSTATWNILAQQVMMARVDRNPTEKIGYDFDQWPGYRGRP